MKKILGIIVLGLLLSNASFAESYKIGQKIEDQIIFSKKNKIDIPKGEWTIIDQYNWHGFGLLARETVLAKIKNNEFLEAISVGEFQLAGVAVGYIEPALHEIMFKNKYDGCYKRPEYYLIKFYVKGSTHNCFTVRHYDPQKEIYNPDDPELRGQNSKIIKWIEDNSIILPKIVLSSEHSYFSRIVGGNWYHFSHIINPKILDSPPIKFYTEQDSEYHKYNIENFPDHKKIMKKWISISAEKHKIFEKNVFTHDRHKLDLTNYYSEKVKPELEISDKSLNQIKQLNDLYKDGVLTKEEFDKAKSKILN